MKFIGCSIVCFAVCSMLMLASSPLVIMVRGELVTSKAQVPDAVDFASTVVSGHKLYVVSGWVNNEPSNWLYEYDIERDTWAMKSEIAREVCDSSAEVIDGKIYVVAGYLDCGGCLSLEEPVPATNLVQVYDIASNSWGIGAPSITPRHSAASAVISGKLYLAGGYRGMEALSVLEVFDPVVKQWLALPEMPTARAGCTGAALNGHFWVVGGWSYHPDDESVELNNDAERGENFQLTVVERYDPQQGKWFAETPLPHPGDQTGVVASNNQLYALIVTDSGTDIVKLNPATKMWVDVAALTDRHLPKPQAFNGVVYAIGGYNRRLDAVAECFDDKDCGENICDPQSSHCATGPQGKTSEL